MVDFTLKPEGYDVPPITAANMAAIMASLGALQAKVAAQDTNIAAVTTTVNTVNVQVSNTNRLGSVTFETSNAQGFATVLFKRSFDEPPGMAAMRIEPSDSAGAIEFSVKSWTTDANGKYIGAVIRLKRQQMLPAMGGLSLLSGVINALANFDVFGGSAANVSFSLEAFQRSA